MYAKTILCSQALQRQVAGGFGLWAHLYSGHQPFNPLSTQQPEWSYENQVLIRKTFNHTLVNSIIFTVAY